MIKALSQYIVLSLIAFCITAFAADPSPLGTVKSLSNQVIAELKQNKTTVKTNKHFTYQIIKKIVLPHVDIDSMSRSALGREGWQQATPKQREQFTQAFTQLLIQTYSSALAQYTDEIIQFLPSRQPTGHYAQVSTRITRIHDNSSISVNYHLVLKNGEWKLYDFSVEGISMIGSFREQFSSELRQNNQNGVEKLIQKLVQHNAENARG